MFNPQPLIPDAVRLQQEIARTQPRGRLIQGRTARELARWFTEASGPGLRTFLATGRVTRQLLTESAVLSLCGATVGLIAAWFGSRSLLAFLSTGAAGGFGPSPGPAAGAGYRYRGVRLRLLRALGGRRAQREIRAQ